jgi:hypothetical protein
MNGMIKQTWVLMIVAVLPLNIIYSQVIEPEKKLKELSKDSINGWKVGGVMAINMAQTSLTNWAAGGDNSIAYNGIFSLFAKYKKNKNAWDNTLDIGYGTMKQGKEDAEYRKTDDKIDFLSKYGREARKNLYYAALLNFKTQMQPGYKYINDTNKIEISNWLAPAYTIGAIGMDYRPNNNLSAFLAPLTSKITIVDDQRLSQAKSFGVDSGKKLKTELGGYIRIIYSKNDFKSEILKNVSFTTKIDLFSNYLENPQNIDINWETLISLKVNKYIIVNFNTQLVYDDNIKISIDKDKNGIPESTGPKIQFKEILGIGFSYNF